jgi:biopolymer transport protein ExbB
MYSLFMPYLEKGGIVNVLIAIVCFVSVYIGLGKLFMYYSFRRSRKALERFLKNNETNNKTKEVKKDWLLKSFSAEYNKNPKRPLKFFHNLFREMLLEKVPQLERGLNSMAAWVSVAPLLGLLGTVVGMVKTFTIITQFGVGNPSLLSEGISVALLTTQSGLTVAFPCLLFHNYLLGQKNIMVKELVADIEKILLWIESRNN